jgi:hypothetical protein
VVEAEPQPVADEIAVDRVAHRLAHAHVAQRLDPVVDLEPGHLRGIFPAVQLKLQIRHGLEARHVERLDVVGLSQLHLAGLQCQRTTLAVRNDPVDDLVQVGLARLPVVVKALHADEVAALPLDELERPRADRMLVRRIGAIVGAVIDMLWHDRRGGSVEHQHERLERRVEREDDGVGIGGGGLLDLVEDWPGAGR